MLKLLVYTVAAVLLYWFSDWILNQIEIRRGARFPNRTVIFFVIILVLAVTVFNLIDYLGLE